MKAYKITNNSNMNIRIEDIGVQINSKCSCIVSQQQLGSSSDINRFSDYITVNEIVVNNPSSIHKPSFIKKHGQIIFNPIMEKKESHTEERIDDINKHLVGLNKSIEELKSLINERARLIEESKSIIKYEIEKQPGSESKIDEDPESMIVVGELVPTPKETQINIRSKETESESFSSARKALKNARKSTKKPSRKSTKKPARKSTKK